jgi:large subunit ribosomal protein L24
MKRIRKGDQVVVIAGKDKGRKGSVTRVTGEGRVFVENVNVVKRHTKPNPQANQPGGIVEREASIDISNVMLLNPKTQKGGRVQDRQERRSVWTHKVRVFRSTGEVIDRRLRYRRHDRGLRYVLPRIRRAGADEEVRLRQPDAGSAPGPRSRSTWAWARPSATRRFLKMPSTT